MLQWQPRALTKKDWCAPRQDKELQTYSVVGWVRVIRKEMADGDWHIELTQQADGPPTHCIVVEIPSPANGQQYATPRQRLTQWIRRADRRPPSRATFGPTGVHRPAYFDGIHVTTGGRQLQQSAGRLLGDPSGDVGAAVRSRRRSRV
jgi:hypothetical protein